ncbi:MAG: PAS domain-containing protein [Planctomycetota bacterium]
MVTSLAASRSQEPPRDAPAMPPVFFRAETGTLAIVEVEMEGEVALGWSKAAWTANGSLTRVLHPDDRGDVERRLAAAAGTRCAVDLECRAVAADGREKRVRLGAIVRGVGDGRSWFEGVLLDADGSLSDQGRRLSERARLHAILDGTRVGTWEWNCQTNETVFNDRWLSTIGYSLAELAPLSLATWERLTHKEDLQVARERLQSHFRGDVDHYECEFRMRHKDGHWVWILARGRVTTRTEAGDPVWMFGTHFDISEAKRDEEQLRANAALLDGLARLQREFLLASDPRTSFDRVLTFLLESTRSAYGFIGEVFRRPSGEPYLRTWAITNIAWDDATKAFFEANAPQGMVFANLQTLFGVVLTTRRPVISNEPQRDPRRGGTPDGHPPLASFLGLPLFLGDDMVGMIGMANREGGYDEALVARLEPLIATCSSLLHAHQLQRQKEQSRAQQHELEVQLQQAQKLESLGLLAGGIAHDFNNLLTGIMGRAEFALSTLREGSEAHEHIARAVEGAQRAGELVNQMLAYAGKVRRGAEPLEVSVIAQEMHRLLEVSMPKRCTLRTEFARDLPRVHADAAQLRQVLMNLVINAGEAVAERGDRVVIRTGVSSCDDAQLREFDPTMQLSEGQYVHIEVEDNGVGMDRATQGRIFEPFFTTKFTGRGLGLSAVLGIVRNHGGSIRCISELGVGTTFRVILPTASDAVEGDDPLRSVRAGRDVWRSSAVVLLVDDDAMVRSVAEHLLAEIGCKVVVARDGVEALEQFERHRSELDLVLLDLTMPRLGGEEVLRELRRRGSRVAVVLTSGYHEQALLSSDTSTSLAGFLHKPYTRVMFRNVMRQALQGRASGPG